MNLGKVARRRNLFFSVFIVNLIFFSAGTVITWTSPSIPYLRSSNPILVINEADSSAIVSAMITGQFFGPIISGILTANIGRKWSIFVTICMFLLHWLLLGLALNVACLYIARLVGGAAVAICLSTLPMYVAEIAEDDIRRVLNSFPFASRSLGFILCYSIGPYVSYRLLIYICSVLPLVLLFLVLMLPESPYYLIDKEQKNKAFTELTWLRGTNFEGVVKEIDVIQASRDKVKAEKVSWTKFFKSSANIKAINYSMLIRFTQEFTGVSVILYLMETIFITAHVSISSSMCPIIVGVVFFIAGCISPIIVNLYGYKKPFVMSLLGLSVSLAVLGLHFFLTSHGFHLSFLKFLPLLCLMSYAVCYAAGIINTSFAIVGEIFAPNVRSLGIAVTNSVGFLMGDLTVFYYYAAGEKYGSSFVMWTYTVFVLIGTLLISIYIPETSRMSLEEIQQYLNKSTINKDKKTNHCLNTVCHNAQNL